jgi:heme-binding protein
MLLSARTARRAVAGAIGTGTVAGAMLFGAMPSAVAQPAPPGPPPPPAPPAPMNCTAADLAFTAGGVSSATSAYLFAHPDVNWFFTSLEGLPREEVRVRVQDYLNQNPVAKAELTGIRQPLVDLKNRCGDTNGDGIADN